MSLFDVIVACAVGVRRRRGCDTQLSARPLLRDKQPAHEPVLRLRQDRNTFARTIVMRTGEAL